MIDDDSVGDSMLSYISILPPVCWKLKRDSNSDRLAQLALHGEPSKHANNNILRNASIHAAQSDSDHS